MFENPINKIATLSYISYFLFLTANSMYRCISERNITEIHILFIVQYKEKTSLSEKNNKNKCKNNKIINNRCIGTDDQFVYDIK